MMKLPIKSVSSRQWKITSVVVSWAVIICLRAMYEFCMVSVPGNSDPVTLSANNSWDEQCAEVQLFRNWQSALAQPKEELSTLSDGDMENMLQEQALQSEEEGVHEMSDQTLSAVPTGLPELSVTPAPPSSMQRATDIPAKRSHVHEVASTAWGQGLVDLQKNLDRQIKQQHLALAEKHLVHQHGAWDDAFSAEIASYEHELCEDPSRKDYPVCVKLHKRDEDTALEENYNQRRKDSNAWVTGLQDLQTRLEERRQALHQKHHVHSRLSSHHVIGMADWAADLEAMHKQVKNRSLSSSSSSSSSEPKVASVSHATTWSMELEALQKRIEARQGRQQQMGEHDILPGDFEDDGHHLLNRIVGLNKQLCEHPERRTLPSCAQFRAEGGAAAASAENSAQRATGKPGSRLRGSGIVARELHDHDEQVRHLQESHRQWEEAFSAKVAAQMREMCSDLRHRSHGHCRDFLEHDVHVPDHLALHWPPKAALDTTPVVVVNRSVLVSARWSGRIPSVGCVTLMPRGIQIEKWMDSFVDNFRHQHYEGGKSLVLVYHHADHKAAKLAKEHADGVFIMAVSALDADFPSTAAARFGMWHVRDADIVAKWDFEAWHHPERLNLQVRALALAGRPASLLARWSVVNSTGFKNTMEAGAHWDGGLVAEGGWMQKNWYPFLREGEEGVVGSHAPQEVVSVDEPGLVAYDHPSL